MNDDARIDSKEPGPHDPSARGALARKLRRVEQEARRKAVKERDKFTGLQIRPTASFFNDADKKEPGEDNWEGFGFDIHPQVTIASALILVTFIVATLMFREQAAELFAAAMETITTTSGWFLILTANVFVIAAVFFAFSRFGLILIGGGLATLQTAAVTTGLPFAVILLLIIYALYVGFSQEAYVEDEVERRLQETRDEHELTEAVTAIVDDVR